jgi:hypothetical protein
MEEKLTDFAMTLDWSMSQRERSQRHPWLRPLLVGFLVAIGAQIGVSVAVTPIRRPPVSFFVGSFSIE